MIVIKALWWLVRVATTLVVLPALYIAICIVGLWAIAGLLAAICWVHAQTVSITGLSEIAAGIAMLVGYLAIVHGWIFSRGFKSPVRSR